MDIGKLLFKKNVIPKNNDDSSDVIKTNNEIEAFAFAFTNQLKHAMMH